MARPRGLRILSGRACVVALSGGPDSAVAAMGSTLHAASTRAVHVHHGLPASDRLAEAAAAVAGHLGIALEVVAVRTDGRSETAARDVRRPALLAALEPGEFLVTGHTRDDLAETVLQRIIRGTGPAGLAAMTPEDDRVLRPLLEFRRADVRSRAEAAGLPFVDDPENDDPTHLRTRIRRTLLPALAEENPDVVGALARLADHARATRSDLPMRLGGRIARIPLPLLTVVGEDRRAAAVREALTAIRPPHPPTTDEVDRTLAVAAGDARRAELDGGLVVLRDRSWLRIGPLPSPAPPATLTVPMRWAGFAFEPHPTGDGGPAVAEVGPGAVVRPPDAADRIAIVGGTKRVADALAEAGVPAELREAWPVVVVDEATVWLPLVRRAQGSRPDDDRYLGIHARSEEAW